MANVILGGQTLDSSDPIARQLISSLLPTLIQQGMQQRQRTQQEQMLDSLLGGGGGGGGAGLTGTSAGSEVLPASSGTDLLGGGPGAPITLGRDPITGKPIFNNLGRVFAAGDVPQDLDPNLRQIGQRLNQAATAPGELLAPPSGVPQADIFGKRLPAQFTTPSRELVGERVAARQKQQPQQPAGQPTGQPQQNLAQVARLASTLSQLGVPQKIQEQLINQALGIDPDAKDLAKQKRTLMLQAQKELFVEEQKKGAQQAREMSAPLGAKARTWIGRDGRPAAPGMSINDAITQGYIPLLPGDLSGVASARSSQYNISEYRELVGDLGKPGKIFFPELSKEGKAGKLNAADLAAVQSNKLNLALLETQGDPNVRRLTALQGAIANLARATGDTANIAVAERQMLLQMLPTFGDSRDSALAVLAQAERVVNAILEARGFPTGGKLPPPPTAPNPNSQQMFINLPDAAANKNREMRDPVTGERVFSNGTTWIPIIEGSEF
jgi:hypothetical protein